MTLIVLAIVFLLIVGALLFVVVSSKVPDDCKGPTGFVLFFLAMGIMAMLGKAMEMQ